MNTMNTTATTNEQDHVEYVITDMERKEKAEAAMREAERCVALAPGRAAVAVEFTAEEIAALTITLLRSSGARGEKYFAMLEEWGVSGDVWHRFFTKVSHAERMLESNDRRIAY